LFNEYKVTSLEEKSALKELKEETSFDSNRDESEKVEDSKYDYFSFF